MSVHCSNNRSQISLSIENPVCTAGQVVRGTVTLAVVEEDAADLHRIQLELHGMERVCCSGVILKETFLKYPQLVNEFRTPANSGESSYEFEISLPVCLPNSLQFAASEVSAEIVYTLSAAVINQRSIVNCKSTELLTVQAEEKKHVPGQFIVMMPHGFPIQTNLVFPRGHIHFGWQCETDVFSTGDHVSVLIVGQNQSDVDIKDFAVRLTESVVIVHPSFNTEVQRVLASTQLNACELPAWKAKSSIASEPVTASFQVPEKIFRESYYGSIFHVQHHIEVIAETATDRTTNPRLSCPVHLLTRGGKDLTACAASSNSDLSNDWENGTAENETSE